MNNNSIDINRKYFIAGYPNHGFWTARSQDNAQLLLVAFYPKIVSVFFDQSGTFTHIREIGFSTEMIEMIPRIGFRTALKNYGYQDISIWLDSLGMIPSTIQVKKFFLERYYIGIVDFPRIFQQTLDNPEAFTEDEQIIAKLEKARWAKESLFELWLNDATNLWIRDNGEIESS